MSKERGKTSLIDSLRRFYTSLFSAFLFLTLFIIYRYFQTDYASHIQDTLDSNFKAFRQLENENERALGQLRERLKGLTRFQTYEQLLEFRSNYEKLNQQLMIDYLSQRELRLVNDKKIPTPLIILPFNLYQLEFDRLGYSVQDLFSKTSRIRAMDFEDFDKDDSKIWKKLSSLKIEPLIDPKRHRILLSRADLKKLDEIDGIDDLRFSHENFSQIHLPRILRVGSDDLLKYNPLDFHRVRSASPSLAKNLDGAEAPLQWNILFLMRKFFRLGVSSHVHAKVVEGSVLERAATVRGEFYETSTRQFMWNYFPMDYLEESPDEDYLLIMPEQFVAASIDHLRLCRSFLPQILKERSPAYGVQVDFPGEPNYFFHAKNGILQPRRAVKTLGFTQTQRLNPARIQWISLAETDPWVQRIFQGEGTDEPIPIHFYTQSSSSEPFLVSSYHSGALDSARVMIYRPWASFMNPFIKKWIWFGIIYSLVMMIFFLQLRKRRILLTDAIEACLRYLVTDRLPNTWEKGRIPREILQLQETMTHFNEAIFAKRVQAELDLGFQRILNEPRKDLDFYLKEFYYLTGQVSEDLRWNLKEEGSAGSKENMLEIELEPHQKRFLREETGRASGIWIEFFKSGILDGTIRDLFQRHFRALVEKASLEHHSMGAEKLAAEIEVASRIRAVLLPPQPEYPGIKFQYRLPEQSAETIILFDHEMVDRKLHFYMAEFSVKGTPASLAAIHVKAFLQGYRQTSSSPSQITGALNDYLLERKIPDLLLSITYGVYMDESSKILCTTAGHQGLFISSNEAPFEQICTRDIPIGILPRQHFQEVEADLGVQGSFGVVSRFQMRRLFKGKWKERLVSSGKWFETEEFKSIQSLAGELKPGSGSYCFLWIQKDREVS